MRYLLWILVVLVLTVGGISANEKLTLERPVYQWVACSCSGDDPNWPPVLGLNQGDFIKQQQYVAGLEHISQSMLINNRGDSCQSIKTERLVNVRKRR